jgi:hypothetical protein
MAAGYHSLRFFSTPDTPFYELNTPIAMKFFRALNIIIQRDQKRSAELYMLQRKITPFKLKAESLKHKAKQRPTY